MDVRRAQSHTHGGNWLPQPYRSLCRCHCPLHSQPGTGLGCYVCLAKPCSAVGKGPVRDRDQEQGQVQSFGFQQLSWGRVEPWPRAAP